MKNERFLKRSNRCTNRLHYQIDALFLSTFTFSHLNNSNLGPLAARQTCLSYGELIFSVQVGRGPRHGAGQCSAMVESPKEERVTCLIPLRRPDSPVYRRMFETAGSHNLELESELASSETQTMPSDSL